jgi:hypothetical protein
MNPNQRPWAETGNRSQDEIFTAVGRALSHWELVEGSIATLFTLITLGNYHAPANPMLRAYAAVTGSANRISMVEAALESWLLNWNCPVGPNAVAALKDCRHWSGRRNDIAHGLVDMFFDELGQWFLIPSLYARRGRILESNPVAGKSLIIKSGYRYNAAMIDSFSDQFLVLHGRMNEATSAMGEWFRIEAAHRTAREIDACLTHRRITEGVATGQDVGMRDST